MGAAVPGISHVLTGGVMEFIMEAPEKLNTDYGQLLPPAECLQWEGCCWAPAPAPGAWFAGQALTPTVRVRDGSGYAACPPLIEPWAVGTRSVLYVPGSMKHPAGVQ